MTVEQMHDMTTEREKSEKQDRQRFEALWWGGALVWAGLVFGADYPGILPQIGKADAWTWVFLGAGLYGMAGNLYRLRSPGLLNPAAWDWIWSGFLVVVGLSGVIVTDMYWPLVLVLVGAVILVSTLRRRQLTVTSGQAPPYSHKLVPPTSGRGNDYPNRHVAGSKDIGTHLRGNHHER